MQMTFAKKSDFFVSCGFQNAETDEKRFIDDIGYRLSKKYGRGFCRLWNLWSEQWDSNPRLSGPKPDALPGCAMLRLMSTIYPLKQENQVQK